MYPPDPSLEPNPHSADSLGSSIRPRAVLGQWGGVVTPIIQAVGNRNLSRAAGSDLERPGLAVGIIGNH